MAKKHSANFVKVKSYYDTGRWDKGRVKAAVGRWITAKEYQEITGESYEND